MAQPSHVPIADPPVAQKKFPEKPLFHSVGDEMLYDQVKDMWEANRFSESLPMSVFWAVITWCITQGAATIEEIHEFGSAQDMKIDPNDYKKLRCMMICSKIYGAIKGFWCDSAFSAAVPMYVMRAVIKWCVNHDAITMLDIISRANAETVGIDRKHFAALTTMLKRQLRKNGTAIPIIFAPAPSVVSFPCNYPTSDIMQPLSLEARAAIALRKGIEPECNALCDQLKIHLQDLKHENGALVMSSSDMESCINWVYVHGLETIGDIIDHGNATDMEIHPKKYAMLRTMLSDTLPFCAQM